jgi:transcriptional regulator with XRE-family HTH domain
MNPVKSIRLTANMTQAEFARRLDISRSSINSYEHYSRRPRYEQAKKIVKFAKLYKLNLTIDDILSNKKSS